MSHSLGDGRRIDHPGANDLVAWGQIGLGIPRDEGETKLAFLRRVFGAEDAVVAIEGDGGFRPLRDDDE